MDTKEGAKCDRKGLCHSGWKEERDTKRYLLNTNQRKFTIWRTSTEGEKSVV